MNNRGKAVIVLTIVAIFFGAMLHLVTISLDIPARAQIITPPTNVDKPVKVALRPRSVAPTPQPMTCILLGTFKITYYTLDRRCVPNSRGITKSGARVDHRITIAVDPKVIPLGSYVYIEGIGMKVAQDTGSKVKGCVIDVYVNKTYQQARQLGTHKAKVYLLKERKK